MVKIYCGTKNPIPMDYDEQGTSYKCLRKGVGIGLHIINGKPPITTYPYKSYCGTKQYLPDGYDYFGSQYECLRKGVGVGLHIQHKNKND